MKTFAAMATVSFALMIQTSVVARDAGFFLSGKADNDLYRVLKLNDIKCSRYDTAAKAIDEAPEGSPVLILAEDYPAVPTLIDPAMLATARRKHLRLYIEYPGALPDLQASEPRRTHWERAVITSDRFGKALEPMRIVTVQDCHYIPFKVANPWIVAAKVAGFDTAVYGVPETAQPLLFEYADGVLVATTSLSQFVTGRYAPLDAWPIIWGTVLEWLTHGKPVGDLKFEPAVHAAYGPAEQMPPDFERQAVIRGVDWYRNARLLMHDEWKHKWEEAAKWQDRVAPAPEQAWPVGDGSCGLLEGFSSRVLYDGNQYVRWYMRADCNAESAMAFALRGLLDGEKSSSSIAGNLLDYVYLTSNLQQGPRANPESPSYGLVGWDTLHATTYYGDDNARVFLGTMGVAGALKSDRWDEALVKGILANFRTAGRNGFRGNALHDGNLQSSGWQPLFAGSRVNYRPHYESWLWATYLWLYDKTGYEPLLERARTAISMTMKAYPDQWGWTNGIQQERARMILPLAWLVRVDDKPEHRRWLRFMADELLDKQDPCGAIREELGAAGQGSYGPPRSNDDYGKHEATLVQKNGDPVCDLLYTTNFAFFALHEAAAATGDRYYKDAEDKLADFLCRIQASSRTRAEFDGAWFRAFEYDRWDYWASNADAGWGTWATETGWTQGWIAGVLALRQKGTSLWDLSADTRIARHFDHYRKHMIPDEVWQTITPRKIEHAAVGCKVHLSGSPASHYAASGAASLTDGIVSSADHASGEWLGYEGQDFEAVVDLGKSVAISSLSADFLQSNSVGIFLPKQVEFAVSTDGEHYRVIATVKHDTDAREAGPLTRRLSADNLSTEAKYVRVKAANIGPIPEWHRARGRKAWLFIDEILVNAGASR
ncbi:MAG: discoidin domain-containing protein [Phycisphaerae bacterium]|nr:discoidin domain-containing protein [Phycisphaerae bacterium]